MNFNSSSNEALHSFDEEVVKRCKLIQQTADQKIENLQKFLQISLLTLSPQIRSMPLRIYLQNHDDAMNIPLNSYNSNNSGNSSQILNQTTIKSTTDEGSNKNKDESENILKSPLPQKSTILSSESNKMNDLPRNLKHADSQSKKPQTPNSVINKNIHHDQIITSKNPKTPKPKHNNNSQKQLFLSPASKGNFKNNTSRRIRLIL